MNLLLIKPDRSHANNSNREYSIQLDTNVWVRYSSVDFRKLDGENAEVSLGGELCD
jgi:hypothetical protein